MKALIICDEKSVIEKLDKILCGCGFDTIIYNWLLKALDNIEEISPNFTIISVSDYPRHWKTLVQFINSGIARSSDKVILYTPKPLSLEEDKKAQALGVAGCFYSFEESEDGLKKLRALLGVKMSDEKINSYDGDTNSSGSIMNTNPTGEHLDETAEDINNQENSPDDSLPAEKAMPSSNDTIPDVDSISPNQKTSEQESPSDYKIQSVDSIAAAQTEPAKEEADTENTVDYKIPTVDSAAPDENKSADSISVFNTKIPNVDSVIPQQKDNSGNSRKSLLHKIQEMYET
ncbi:MAG: hypothetical protein ACTTKX_02760 [Treponema sp.]